MIIFLESFFPRYQAYKPSSSERTVNIFFFAIDQCVLKPFLTFYLLFCFFPFMKICLPLSFLSQFWPHYWPSIVQSILAFLLITLSTYWSHRLMHQVPFLWKFHRFHHLPSKLNWWVAFWNHPFHTLMTFSFGMFFPLLFAIPEDILALPFLLTILVGTLNHANIKTNYTVLNYFFPSILEHEIHHSSQRVQGKCNYGVSFLLWDHVFKTYKKPDKSIKKVGLKEHLDIQEDRKIVFREFLWPIRIEDTKKPPLS